MTDNYFAKLLTVKISRLLVIAQKSGFWWSM